LAALVRRVAAARGTGATLARVAALALVALAADRAIAPDIVSFGANRSFLLAIATGLANTIKVAALGITLATVLGFLIGIARMTANPLVRGAATIYVELFRNVPLLIQIFFWYFAVLRALPGVRASIDLLGIAAINNRGIYLPRLVPGDGAPALAAIALAALVAIGAVAAARHRRTARAATAVAIAAGGCAALLAATRAAASVPFTLEYPRLVGFNFEGGTVVSPEYGALLLGLTLYSAAYIAEIVRSGLAGVGRGQRDAAQALGLDRIQTLRLVVVPQALRIAIPPLISQYLALTKDSSLGIAIGYPEIVSVTGQVINQTGQAIEMLVIALAIYMALSLSVAAILGWYDARMKWVPL
jgi:general L-amino acid transport system permease protein